MIELDAKGLCCPEPLMMAADAVEQHPNEQVRIEVDSAAPRDNIARMARRKGLAIEIAENEGVYALTIG